MFNNNAIENLDLSPFGEFDDSNFDLSKTLTIQNKKGLHARASAAFVKTSSAYDADMIVEKDGHSVNGTSIMGLMMLAASIGTEILVKTKGEQAHEALNAIEELVNNKFGEEE
jgi:phosphocarrier protein